MSRKSAARIPTFTMLLAVLALGGCMTGNPVAEKPIDRPYAAGSPSGGIPLWNPGDKFVGVSGGACNGTCPIYELYVFDDGRVVFSGKKYTSKTGVWRKEVDRNVYRELLLTIVRTGALDGTLKRGTCLSDRPPLIVMRSAPDGQSVRTQTMNTGCEGYADVAKQIESQFIDLTETAAWLAGGK